MKMVLLASLMLAKTVTAQLRPVFDPSIGLTSRNLNFVGNLDAGVGYGPVALNASVMGIVENNPQYGFYASANAGTEQNLFTIFAGTNWAGQWKSDREKEWCEFKWRPMVGVRYNCYKAFVDIRYTSYDWRLCLGWSLFKPKNEGLKSFPRG